MGGLGLKLHFRMVNIRGSRDFLDGWQKHHLIPIQCTKDATVRNLFGKLALIGFSVHDFDSNGILLPATVAEAERAGLPFHCGPHKDYNLMIIDAVRLISSRYDFVGDSDQLYAALSQIRLMQARLRVSMSQDFPISIDLVQPRTLFEQSTAIDRAIQTLVLVDGNAGNDR
jgi:hypothetical protein